MRRGQLQVSASAICSLTIYLAAMPFTAAQESPPYKLGLVTSLSGLGSTYADDNILGVKAAIDEINTKNLAGRRFELTVADDASDPKTAIEVCTRLVLNDNIDAIIVNSPTPARIACNLSAQRNMVPFLIGSASAGDVCAPNLFGLGQVPNQMSSPLVTAVIKQGLRSFYLIGSDYSTPKAGLADARQHIEAQGGRIAGTSLAAVGTADFSSEIAKIAASKADVVFQNLVGADSVTFHKQFSQDPRVAGVKRADLLLGETIAKRLGKSVQGVFSVSSYFAEINSSANEAFKAADSQAGSQSRRTWRGVPARLERRDAAGGGGQKSRTGSQGGCGRTRKRQDRCAEWTHRDLRPLYDPNQLCRTGAWRRHHPAYWPERRPDSAGDKV